MKKRGALKGRFSRSLIELKEWIKKREKWIGCVLFSGGIAGIIILNMIGFCTPKVVKISENINEVSLNQAEMQMVWNSVQSYGLYAAILGISFFLLLLAPLIMFKDNRKVIGLTFVSLFVGIIIEYMVIICCIVRGEIFRFAIMFSWIFLSFVIFLGFRIVKKTYDWMKNADGEIDLGKLVFVWGVIVFIFGCLK